MHSFLISIKVLCDAGYIVMYLGNKCKTECKGQAIWAGHQEPSKGLWLLPLRGSPSLALNSKPAAVESANNVYQMTSKEVLVKFLNQCLLSPSKVTLLKALEKQPTTDMADHQGRRGQAPTQPLTCH